MNKNKIINIGLDVVIVLLIICIIIINVFPKNEEDIQDELSVDLTNYENKNLEDKFVVDDFKFYDTSIMYFKDYKSTITVNIQNTSKNNYFIKGITAIIYDKDKKEVAALYNDMQLIVESESKVEYLFETTRNIYESIYTIEYVPTYELIEN